MKILFDHQIFQSQAYGGISRYFAETLPRLAGSTELDVSLFLGRSINKYGLERRAVEFKNFWGRPAKNWELKSKLATKFNRLQFPVFAAKTKPDLIHFTYYRDTNPFFKGKRVVTIYDMIHEIYPEEFGSGDATSQWKKDGVSKSDLIISISESTKQDLVRLWGIDPQKIFVIHLANSLFVEAGGHPLQNKPFLLFVGLRKGYKNFHKLLGALAALPEKNLQLVAYGGPAFAADEHQLIKELGLTDRVHHRVGGDRDLATFYRHAEAFVFPTTYEGFGIPPLEAMHYGCPVISSNRSSVPEVVGDAGLLVDTNDIDVLKAAIAKVISDSSLRADLIGRGRSRTRQFSWDRCAQEHERLYKKLF